MPTHPEYAVLTKHYYRLMTAIIVRDGYGCACCGSYSALVADHIVSVWHGGKTELDNLQQLCHRCNRLKLDRTEDYRPSNRGELGRIPVVISENGLVMIRLRDYDIAADFSSTLKWTYSEALARATLTNVRVKMKRFPRGISIPMRNVYPPDWQHII